MEDKLHTSKKEKSISGKCINNIKGEECNFSPVITEALVLKSHCSQRHKESEDNEQHMLVSGGWAERSRLPMQCESIQLRLCAFLF